MTDAHDTRFECDPTLDYGEGDCAACEAREDDQAHKADAGKARWDLLPWGPVRDIVAVLTHGAERYGAESWQRVPQARSRYSAAMMRHAVAWLTGERVDPDSGLPHLAHLACNALFLAHFDALDEPVPYAPVEVTCTAVDRAKGTITLDYPIVDLAAPPAPPAPPAPERVGSVYRSGNEPGRFAVVYEGSSAPAPRESVAVGADRHAAARAWLEGRGYRVDRDAVSDQWIARRLDRAGDSLTVAASATVPMLAALLGWRE